MHYRAKFNCFAIIYKACLRPFLSDIFAHVHVIVNLFEGEHRPWFSLVQPGSGTDGTQVSSWDILPRDILGDLQNFLRLRTGIAITHDLHGIEQPGSGVESDDKIFLTLSKRYIEQG